MFAHNSMVSPGHTIVPGYAEIVTVCDRDNFSMQDSGEEMAQLTGRTESINHGAPCKHVQRRITTQVIIDFIMIEFNKAIFNVDILHYKYH